VRGGKIASMMQYVETFLVHQALTPDA
jgi:hypothetical protein